MSNTKSMESAMLNYAQSLLTDDWKRFPREWPRWICVVIRKHTRPWSSKEPKDRANYVWFAIERDKSLHYVNKEYFRTMRFELGRGNTEITFALTTLGGGMLDPNISVSQISHGDILVLRASLTATAISGTKHNIQSLPVKTENDPIWSVANGPEEGERVPSTCNAPGKSANSYKTLDSAETDISVDEPSLIVRLPVRSDQLNKNENITLQCRTCVFAPSMDENLAVAISSKSLEKLANEDNMERLEAGIVAGLEILADIEGELRVSQHTSTWLTQIEEIRKDAARPPTIIGVVGNTGAGKSSVINALLDEEQLVPTNCMRACTAVVTEISFNYSNNAHARYRAEIEFIKPEDWRKELEILFDAVFDEKGQVSRAVFMDDSEASIAYAKIRAVYNRYTNDMLQHATVDSLMAEEKVSSILGSISRFCAGDPVAFYRKLQQYVDSSEKDNLNVLGHRIGHGKRDFGYWPLIKVVKIYTKSEALSTGAVVVDLPGVHDSNAARAAIAESYMMKCNSLWIVAPITRAVDDKAAKVLLGKTFKRQLQFDDAYSAVTFICSKTDDISITEATQSLRLGEQMAQLNSTATSLQSSKYQLQQELELVAKEIKTTEASIDTLGEEIEALEPILLKTEVDRLRQGQSGVDADATSDQSRKRARYDVDQEASMVEETTIRTALELAKSKLKNELNHQRNLRRQRDHTEQHIKVINEQEADNTLQLSILCIAGRNEYSRKAIQQDFASGIRELDMTHKEEEDPDNFDPTDEIRDYDLLAQQLPVFCVSSRAYQQLRGKFRKDASVAGFKEIEHTEIPQLQEHCKQLTIRARKTSYRKFLNSLQQFIDSINLWASSENVPQLTAEQYNEEKAFMIEALRELESALERVTKATIGKATRTLNLKLMAKFGQAARRAESTATPTCMAWGRPKDIGGLAWATYKAVVRHHGVFQSSAVGLQDFNGNLAEPILEALAMKWETAFQRLLPKIFSEFSLFAGPALDACHKSIERRCQDQDYALAQIALLRNQCRTYAIMLNDVVSSALQMLTEGQRSSSRGFTPTIARSMEPAFAACTQESGKGQYERMKTLMANHVQSEAQSMFRTATSHVQNSLKQLFAAIEKMMLGRISEILANLHHDYMSLLGVEVTDGACSRFIDSATRRVVLGILVSSESKFLDVLEGHINDVTNRYNSVNDLTPEAFKGIEDACIVEDNGEDDE